MFNSILTSKKGSNFLQEHVNDDIYDKNKFDTIRPL